jgi:hypothetical protein
MNATQNVKKWIKHILYIYIHVAAASIQYKNFCMAPVSIEYPVRSQYVKYMIVPFIALVL